MALHTEEGEGEEGGGMRAGYLVQGYLASWAGQVPEETPPNAVFTRPISPPLLSSTSSPLHLHTCPRSLKRPFAFALPDPAHLP